MRNRLDLFILACAAIIAVSYGVDIARHALLFADFRAFWCSGSLVLSHQNPYAQTPLYACESTIQPFGIFRATHGTAVPAPYPGYVLCVFALFALLPFVPAAILWCALSIAALAVAARVMAAQFNLSWMRAFATVGVLYAFVALVYGEVGPIVLCAIAVAIWALRRGKWSLAGAAFAVVAVLPQIAIPVWLAAAIYCAPIRAKLLFCGALLLLFDIAAGGPGIAIAYVRDVLPAHASAEAARTSQYGLSWLFTAVGLRTNIAVRLADVAYICAVTLSLFAVRARVRDDIAQVVVVPLLCAVATAPFIHFSGVLLTIPAALAVLAAATHRARTALSFAVVAIALPWLAMLDQPVLLPVLAGAAFFISRDFAQRSIPVALRTTAGAALFGGILLIVAAHGGPSLTAHGIAGKSAIAESSWVNYVENSSAPVWWIAKGIAWFGLWTLTLGGVFGRTDVQHVPAVAVA